MVNKANIDTLIGWIKDDQGKHFRMLNWQLYLNRPDNIKVEKYEHCNTAFCLGGWIDQHLQRQRGATNETLRFDAIANDYIDHGGEWLGINRYDARKLFHMPGEEFARLRFDKLSQSRRAEIAIKVLEHLRDTGEVDWEKFLPFDPYEPTDEL